MIDPEALPSILDKNSHIATYEESWIAQGKVPDPEHTFWLFRPASAPYDRFGSFLYTAAHLRALKRPLSTEEMIDLFHDLEDRQKRVGQTNP